MSERRTTIITASDAKAVGGTVALAALGLSAGLLAIDHHFSPKGQSAWTKLNSWMHGAHAHGHVTGADAQDLKRLPAYAQQAIQHAIMMETDQSTLTQLADNLQAAGFTSTAAQVRAKVHG